MKNSMKDSLETIIAKHTNPLFAKELSSWKPNLEAHDIHFIDGKTLTGIAGFVPENAVVIVEGDVHIDGTLVTAGEWVENNFLIITGNVKCNDLFVADDSTTLIAGSVTVKDLAFCSARDSLFCVFGPTDARLLYSGNGAGWLTGFHDSVSADALESYVEDGRTHQAHTINKKAASASVRSLLHDTLFDWTEWNDLDPEEQEDLIEAGELPVDYAVLDSKKLLNQLLEGKSVFK